jgi:hypothetical protein
VPDALAFGPHPDGLIIRPPAGDPPSRRLRPVGILFGALLLVVVVAGAYRYWPHFSKSGEGKPLNPDGKVAIVNNPGNRNLPTSDVFPRRLLAISVNNYLYANSVGEGSPDHNVYSLVQRISRVLQVPRSQILVFSETKARTASKTVSEASYGPASLSPEAEKLPKPCCALKPILEKTISAFLESCRAQDRILVLFIGHMVSIGAEAYLVPLEGEPDAKETLIPLSWLYEQLARCKARQKAVILDTCRFDPTHSPERPGNGPMTATLDGLLQKPPAGVQLWSACVAGQYSYEADGSGIFLDKLYEAMQSSAFKNVPEPQEPLPIDTWAQIVNRSTAAEVTSRIGAWNGQKAVQTPRLAGQWPEQGAAFDKDEPLPQTITVPPLSLPSGGMAKQEQIRSILNEIDLPPIKPAHVQPTRLEMDALLPFSAAVIERYQPDYRSLSEIQQDSNKYPLRLQVLATVKLLRATFDPQGPQGSPREYFQGSTNERVKAAIFKEQMKPAQMLSELMERLEALRKAGEQRGKEPSPRWQAHYDYILAELLARTAYVSEYNLMLGKIRKDELPELRPGVATGWRLVPREKMQTGKEFRDMAAESKKLFAKLIKDHPGTPWEILAKCEKWTALGLEWQPSP